MKKLSLTKKILVILLGPIVSCCSTTYAAPPLPKHNIEGNSGVFITPTAYLTNPPEDGKVFGKPSISASFATIGEKDFHGKGYGTEALRLLIAYAFDTLNLQKLEIEVFSSNPRALACYKKVGFVEEGRKRRRYYIRGEYKDAIQLGMLKEEFQE